MSPHPRCKHAEAFLKNMMVGGTADKSHYFTYFDFSVLSSHFWLL